MLSGKLRKFRCYAPEFHALDLDDVTSEKLRDSKGPIRFKVVKGR